MPTDVDLYAPAGGAPLSTLPPWSPEAVGGIATDADPIEVWNNRDGGGADTARRLRLAVASDVEDAAPAIREGWYQARITGGLGGLAVTAGDWQVLTDVLTLELPDLAAGEGVALERRIVAPADLEDVVAPGADVQLRVLMVPAPALNSAGLALGARGVIIGLGDPRVTDLRRRDGLVVADGTATVQVPAVGWIWRGQPRARVGQGEALDNLDGAAEALGAGESYVALLSLGDAYTVTKGLRATVPAAPSLPAGHLLLASVVRADDGVIDQPDVTMGDPVGGMDITSIVALTLTLGAGPVLTGDTLADLSGPYQVTVADDVTSWVWVTPSGGLATTTTTTSEPPVAGAELLYRVTAAAGAVTETLDLRRWAPMPEVLSVPLPGALTMGREVHWHNPHPHGLLLDPARPVVLTAGADPGGNASGSTVVEIERWDGAAWASLYPSSGTQDLRPAIAWDSVDLLDAGSLPEVLVIEPADRLRVRVVGVPDVNPHADGWVSIRAWGR